jgi:2-polyprenyl-3-methyl-5-hydroxy-6-metoxy-1,4-benzoquinol methylase
MRKTFTYSFIQIEACNMCGAGRDHMRILGKRLNRAQGRNPSKKTGITTTVVKCDRCQLIFANPLPLPGSIQDHYGVLPENYWNEEYFRPDPDYFAQELRTLSTLQTVQPGSRSLDIGSGIGKCMIALSAKGFDAYGFEPSLPFYERSLDKMKLSKERQSLDSMETASYPENHFDFITFGAVLEHLADPSASIAKAMKWLKPGGIIHIEVPSSAWLVSKIINFYYAVSGTDYVGNISPMHPPYHLYEFGLKSFQEHASRNNYDIALVQYGVCQSYMPKLLDVFIRPYMKHTNTGMQMIIWLKKK